MPSPLRLAFLGCGFITRVHSRTCARSAPPPASAIASRDLGRAEAFCRDFGGTRAYGGYAEALADPAVDAVVIAVPPAFHKTLALQALEAGKHVLVEKPAFPALRRLSRRDPRPATAPAAWCWSARTTTTSRWRCGCAAWSPPAPSARWCSRTSPPSPGG